MSKNEIIESIDSNGKLHLSNILDIHTGEPITFTETAELSALTPTTPGAKIIYRKYKGKILKRDFIGDVFLDWFGPKGDGVNDNRKAITDAIGFCQSRGGGVIRSVAIGNFAFSGRIRIPYGVVIDTGRSATASQFHILDVDGGIELEAGGGFFGEIRALKSSFVGPAFEINDQKTVKGFGRNDRKATFNAGIRGNRQVGSKGALIQSSSGTKGVSWTEGHFEIGEMDFPMDFVSNATGYINENWISAKVYDGIENCRMLVNGTGEISSNRINLTTQTGSNGRSGINLICDGKGNTINLKCWDWHSDKLNLSSYDGTQVLFTEKSGYNIVAGAVSRGLAAQPFAKMGVIDLAPNIRRNFIELDDSRVKMPSRRNMAPGANYAVQVMAGDQDDELAFASSGRHTVTQSGINTLSPIEALFEPNGKASQSTNATEIVVTVDLGALVNGSDIFAIGILFQSANTKPDKCKVEFSSDGSAWSTILVAGYDGGAVPLELSRYDSSLANTRYIRLTCENNIPKNMSVNRLFLANCGTSRKGGAYVPKSGAEFYGRPNLLPQGSSTPGLNVEGTKVIGRRVIGWAMDTGAAKRTANATYVVGSSLTIGATYSQAEITALRDRVKLLEEAMRDQSQTMMALKADIQAHGLIGSTV